MYESYVYYEYVVVYACLCTKLCGCETHLIVNGGLFLGTSVNSQEILLHLPLNLFCYESPCNVVFTVRLTGRY